MNVKSKQKEEEKREEIAMAKRAGWLNHG